MSTIETIRFKLRDGVGESAFRALNHEVETRYMARRPGFQSRETAVSADGEWFVSVHWATAEDAKRTVDAFFSAPETQAFLAAVDVSTVSSGSYQLLPDEDPRKPLHIVNKSDLPSVRLGGEIMARIFDGGAHGDGANVSAFIVDLPPGAGPKRHVHPYEEVFITLDGKVELEAGGTLRTTGPDEVCVVPAGVPHTFTNVGTERAVMVNVHAGRSVATEFVEGGPERKGYEFNHAEGSSAR
ncbi:cupin domain-containing protein [Amycolatopsis dendrobii]|uniref:Cupin domain-containing protein n=1 Tax=Amycolatopsis dendrobii TaxID=2760662 RepID=A0A7W3VZW9_9PSEU|nr:cupin domain-containing protein [Amycolatopsis dendrobii]MBB1156109.1 cupin domain-containing protein [Amycolatopsis dendrobii]